MSQDGATPRHLRLDALLPPEMAKLAEEAGVRKASLDTARMFALAVLAGAFIALGAVLATVALAGTGAAPWGAVRMPPVVSSALAPSSWVRSTGSSISGPDPG